MRCQLCEAITPNSYKLCPNCLTKLERERFVVSDKEHEIIEEVSPYVECGEIKAKDEEIAKLEQQIGFSDIYIQDLETQIKAKDERIKELEEAMKHKTCKGCVHEVEDMQDLYCAFCSRSCDDNFEPKDNA